MMYFRVKLGRVEEELCERKAAEEMIREESAGKVKALEDEVTVHMQCLLNISTSEPTSVIWFGYMLNFIISKLSWDEFT